MRSNACSWTMVTSKLLWDWPKHPRSIGERDRGWPGDWRGCRESEVKGGWIFVGYIFRVWRIWEEVLHWFTKTFGYEVWRCSIVASPFRATEPHGTRLWVWWAKQLFLCREYWLNQGDWTVKSRIGMDEWQLQISSSLGWGERYRCCVPTDLCSSKMYIISRIHYIRHVNDYEMHVHCIHHFSQNFSQHQWSSPNDAPETLERAVQEWYLEAETLRSCESCEAGNLEGLFLFHPNWHETYQFKTEKLGSMNHVA